MPRRRSDKGGLVPADGQGLLDMLDAMTPIGDVKSWKEFAEDPNLQAGLFALLGTVPGLPARKIQRDWPDVPLKGNSRKFRNMKEKFLIQNGYKELEPWEKPRDRAFKYTEDGKIQAFSAYVDKNGKKGLSTDTFDDSTTLKTLRRWAGG